MRLPEEMSLDAVVAGLGPSHKVQPMLVESQAQAAPMNLSAPLLSLRASRLGASSAHTGSTAVLCSRTICIPDRGRSRTQQCCQCMRLRHSVEKSGQARC